MFIRFEIDIGRCHQQKRFCRFSVKQKPCQMALIIPPDAGTQSRQRQDGTGCKHSCFLTFFLFFFWRKNQQGKLFLHVLYTLITVFWVQCQTFFEDFFDLLLSVSGGDAKHRRHDKAILHGAQNGIYRALSGHSFINHRTECIDICPWSLCAVSGILFQWRIAVFQLHGMCFLYHIVTGRTKIKQICPQSSVLIF